MIEILVKLEAKRGPPSDELPAIDEVLEYLSQVNSPS